MEKNKENCINQMVKPNQDMFKMSKFQNVPSKVRQTINK